MDMGVGGVALFSPLWVQEAGVGYTGDMPLSPLTRTVWIISRETNTVADDSMGLLGLQLTQLRKTRVQRWWDSAGTRRGSRVSGRVFSGNLTSQVCPGGPWASPSIQTRVLAQPAVGDLMQPLAAGVPSTPDAAPPPRFSPVRLRRNPMCLAPLSPWLRAHGFT